MTTTVYLATAHYKGLYVSTMRIFDNVVDAAKHAWRVSSQSEWGSRVYEFAPGQPPKLLKYKLWKHLV